jgi:hypothetical protein
MLHNISNIRRLLILEDIVTKNPSKGKLCLVDFIYSLLLSRARLAGFHALIDFAIDDRKRLIPKPQIQPVGTAM